MYSNAETDYVTIIVNILKSCLNCWLHENETLRQGCTRIAQLMLSMCFMLFLWIITKLAHESANFLIRTAVNYYRPHFLAWSKSKTQTIKTSTIELWSSLCRQKCKLCEKLRASINNSWGPPRKSFSRGKQTHRWRGPRTRGRTPRGGSNQRGRSRWGRSSSSTETKHHRPFSSIHYHSTAIDINSFDNTRQ